MLLLSWFDLLQPTDPLEHARLEINGFKVVRGRIYDRATGRGGLNLSRALGDFHYRDGVPCQPDVVERRLTDDDLLLVLGTDGLWDVLSNERACAIALRHSEPADAARVLVETALEVGSSDNVTALVVQLNPDTAPRK